MRVYVPLDGTPEAERALEPAAFLLRHSVPPHSLVLGRIFRDPLSIPDAFADLSRVHPRFVRDECVAKLIYLQAIAHRPEWIGITVACKVGLGEPAQMVGEQARLAQADLVVMTTHSRTGFDYAMLGSYAEEIVHASHQPILLIRSAGEIFPAPERIPTPRILIPLDGSAWATEVLEPATWFADALQAKFLLVQVVPESARENEPERVNAVDEYLRTCCARLEQAGYDAETQLLWGEPAASLVQVCEAEHIDLVAMMTHARMVIGQKTIGRVARHLHQHTQLPLLLLHRDNVE